jgi:hypothetical protein
MLPLRLPVFHLISFPLNVYDHFCDNLKKSFPYYLHSTSKNKFYKKKSRVLHKKAPRIDVLRALSSGARGRNRIPHGISPVAQPATSH